MYKNIFLRHRCNKKFSIRRRPNHNHEQWRMMYNGETTAASPKTAQIMGTFAVSFAHFAHNGSLN